MRVIDNIKFNLHKKKLELSEEKFEAFADKNSIVTISEFRRMSEVKIVMEQRAELERDAQRRGSMGSVCWDNFSHIVKYNLMQLPEGSQAVLYNVEMVDQLPVILSMLFPVNIQETQQKFLELCTEHNVHPCLLNNLLLQRDTNIEMELNMSIISILNICPEWKDLVMLSYDKCKSSGDFFIDVLSGDSVGQSMSFEKLSEEDILAGISYHLITVLQNELFSVLVNLKEWARKNNESANILSVYSTGFTFSSRNPDLKPDFLITNDLVEYPILLNKV